MSSFAVEDLLGSITRAQARFIASEDSQSLFDGLLEDLLRLTESEYGFIGEVLEDGDGRFLKTHALTNIAWNEETRRFYEENAPDGLEFRNLDTLFGAVIRTGEKVLAEDPASDPRAGGVPEGHPALRRFMGLPFFWGEQLIGCVGIANRATPYDETLIRDLQPFLSVCANIINAYRAERLRHSAVEHERRSRALSLALLDNVSEAVLVVNAAGAVEQANRVASVLFRIPLDTLVGMDIAEIFGSDDGQAIVGQLRRALWTGNADHLGDAPNHIRVRHSARGSVQCTIQMTRIDVPGGSEPFFALLLRDVTAETDVRARLESYLATVEAVVESSPTALIMTDTQGRITLVNSKAEEYFGYSRGELVGGTVEDLVPKPDRGRHAEHREAFFREKATARLMGKGRGLHARRKDGGTFPVEIGLTQLETPSGIAALASVVDITERRRGEEEREELIRDLKEALENVETLSGLLPICASCKKIRDDRGYWNQIEAYLSHRSGARFSHGICPDCAVELYGEFLGEEEDPAGD